MSVDIEDSYSIHPSVPKVARSDLETGHAFAATTVAPPVDPWYRARHQSEPDYANVTVVTDPRGMRMAGGSSRGVGEVAASPVNATVMLGEVMDVRQTGTVLRSDSHASGDGEHQLLLYTLSGFTHGCLC